MLAEKSSMQRSMTVSGLVEDVLVFLLLLLLLGVFLVGDWICFQRAKVSAMVNSCLSPNKALTLPAMAAAVVAGYEIMRVNKRLTSVR